jgi:hypothetical protein
MTRMVTPRVERDRQFSARLGSNLIKPGQANENHLTAIPASIIMLWPGPDNRSGSDEPQTGTLTSWNHVLSTLWFRSTWSWENDSSKATV